MRTALVIISVLAVTASNVGAALAGDLPLSAKLAASATESGGKAVVIGQFTIPLLLLILFLGIALRIMDNTLKFKESLPVKTVSPYVLMVVLTLIIFVSEFSVMLVLETLPDMPPLVEAALDSLLLTAFILPTLSLFLFRPLVEHIRDRRRVEESLKESEENVRAIIKSAGEGILVINHELEIQLVNEELLGIFGYNEEDLLQKRVTILSPGPGEPSLPDHAKLDSGSFHNLLMSTGKRVKTSGRKKDGKLFPMEVRIERTRQEAGVSLYVGAFRDITERENAQIALRESEEKFRSAFEEAAIGMVLSSLDGYFLQVNSSFCGMTGYSREELLRKSFVEITHPDDVEEDLENTRRAIRGEINSFKMEKRYIHKSGAHIWVILNVATITDNDSKPSFFIAQIEDITERKKTELELVRAKEEAEESTLLKDKFVSLVAHDLRSPFVSIGGLLKLLLADKSAVINEKQEAMLKAAIGNSEQAVDLIDELLNISRLKTGVIRPKRKFVDARSIALMAISSLSHIAARKNVKLENHVSERARLYVDPRLFGEALNNLISNAIKFSYSGGVVEVFSPSGGRCGIGVKDHGMGVMKEFHGKLFRYDEKTHTRGTMDETGTGLGLPLSYDIMLAHGGALEYSSEEGAGAVFQALLPRILPVIMVVEESGEITGILNGHFSDGAVEIITRKNPEEALALMNTSVFHMVIVDTQTGLEKALELVEICASGKGDHFIPVIVVLPQFQAGEANKILHYSSADFVTRPLDAGALATRVNRFII